MSKYYYTDGKERFGPFSLEELGGKKISKETLVWMEGLTDWIPAGNLAELQPLFPMGMPNIPPVSSPYNPVMMEKPPKNWLVESILVTLLCCLPFGIVGIVYATKVESLWVSGQHEASIKASKDAGKWVRIGFFCGIAVYVLYGLAMIFGLVASFSPIMNNEM
jgi:hypothetical protein